MPQSLEPLLQENSRGCTVNGRSFEGIGRRYPGRGIGVLRAAMDMGPGALYVEGRRKIGKTQKLQRTKCGVLA